MTSAHIRFARPGDAAAIHRFICELAEYEREPDAVVVTAEVLTEQLSAPRPPFECLVAELEGVSVGFALFFTTYSTWLGQPGLYLEDLYVQPAHRGRGVGQALLARLAAITVERGGGRLEWSVLDWNEPALRFYRAAGATGLDEWTRWRLTGASLEAMAERDE